MKLENLKKFGILASLVLGSVVTLAGCEPKGPAEKAGENIDQAGKNLKDAVDPRGPAEKVGDKIDDAVGK
jgi:predicted small secreted protein